MMLSLSNSLSRTRRSGLDADAAAYIAAVESALGSSITGTQRTAINDFIAGEKAASRYTLLKRLYLPIWGQAAANAIDMISLTSGTFNGTVTHAAGYVQGDGTTGYFDAGTAASAGVASGSASMFGLFLADVQSYMGGRNASDEGLLLADNGSGVSLVFGRAFSAERQIALVFSDAFSIGMISATAANARGLYRRHAGGFSTLGTDATTDNAALSADPMYFAGAWYNISGPTFQSNTQHGLYGVGLGYSAAQAEPFTLALKDLWETCTGSAIP